MLTCAISSSFSFMSSLPLPDSWSGRHPFCGGRVRSRQATAPNPQSVPAAGTESTHHGSPGRWLVRSPHAPCASGESMDFDTLWVVADRARARPRLAPNDVSFVRDVAPDRLDSFPKLELPTSIRHPAGFSISGASVGTSFRSALLIAGQKCAASCKTPTESCRQCPATPAKTAGSLLGAGSPRGWPPSVSPVREGRQRGLPYPELQARRRARWLSPLPQTARKVPLP
jgi:hypothetical protein